MGRNYADTGGERAQLGYHRNSDYANLHGSPAISVLVRVVRDLRGSTELPIGLDLRRLGLTRELLEQNGLNFGKNTDPMPYIDTSANPPAAGRFHHTAETHAHVPDDGRDQHLHQQWLEWWSGRPPGVEAPATQASRLANISNTRPATQVVRTPGDRPTGPKHRATLDPLPSIGQER